MLAELVTIDSALLTRAIDASVVGEDGTGDLYCLEVTGISEAPVVIFQPGVPEMGQSRELIASDFGVFFLEEIKRQLQ